MLYCHGAQNIGLSNHKLKSAPTFTVSQCMHVPDGQTMDEHRGSSTTICSKERIVR